MISYDPRLLTCFSFHLLECGFVSKTGRKMNCSKFWPSYIIKCLESGYQIKSLIRVAFVNGTDLKYELREGHSSVLQLVFIVLMIN